MSAPASSGGASQQQYRLYLNCPFDEKDEAKSLGALWDATKRQWYIAPETPCRIFSKWLTRTYLDCPYEDKDKVKSLGAKWDTSVKRWYVPTTAKDEEVFAQWLGRSEKPTKAKPKTKKPAAAPSTSSGSSPKTKKTNKTVEVAVVNKATLPRISSDMTVKQLRDECLARNPAIKGVGSKDKTWLIEYLQLGSVWISASRTDLLAETPTIDSNNKKKKASSPEGKRKQPPNAKESGTKKSRKEENDCPSKKPTAKKKQSTSTLSDLQSMPRVSETCMTLAQLSAELLARQPAAKGLSNKTKDWFVEQLGEGSIWTTAPGKTIDLAAVPSISDELTLVQLKEELLARHPTAAGLSSKTKDWFLQRLGVGSIWMTSFGSQSRLAPTQKPPASASSPRKKVAPAAGQEKTKSNTTGTKKVPTPTSSAKVTACATRKDPPGKKESSVAKTSKVKMAATSSATKLLPPTAPKAVKVEKKKPAAKPNVPTSAAIAQPSPVVSRSSLDVFAPDPVVSQKSTAKHATLVKVESSVSKTTMTKAATKEPQPKKVPGPERNEDGLPIVSSRMTMPQLKEELLARIPKFKGYSKLKSGDFLAQLGIGSVWESHPESRQARARELKQHHSISSMAHHHPMADSSVIRCSVMFGTQKTRAQVARCDRPHSWNSWCRTTPYRSCTECDFDLCIKCYEIECLPEAEKKAELDRRYDKMVRDDAKAQRRYEEEQAREMARWEASDRAWKEEFEKIIRDPPAKHLDENNKLQFTVWTSCGYDFDLRPAKEFNSSYATIEEANQRVEYVFLFNSPWGLDLEEMHSDEDFIDAKGFRRMEVTPADSERWTVSVVPSQVFEYLDY